MWDVVHRFQREAPVARVGNDFVLVTKYHDVREVMVNSELFTNAGNLRQTGVNAPLEDRALGELDPPVHGPIRQLAMSAMPHSSIEGMRSFTRATCEELLKEILDRGRGDLVGRFSVLVTNRVVAKMLGVPLDRGDWLAEQAEAIMKSEFPLTNQTPQGIGYKGAFPEFSSLLDELIATRMNADGEGDAAIDRIVQGACGNFEEPAKIARMILIQLLLGGTATTRDFIGHLFHRLIQSPELHTATDANRSLIPVAVDEGLRLDPPVLFTFRTCSENTPLRGVDVNSGERVIIAFAAANRDEEMYEDPDTFRLDRVDPAPSLTFGYGSHFCLGSPLAKMESQTALEVFLDMVKPGSLHTLPGFKIQYMPTSFLYGPVSLDVERVT